MALSWVPDWSWGLPLLVLTIVAHVSAIVLTVRMLGLTQGSGARSASRFVILVAIVALAAAVYLALEAAAWAGLEAAAFGRIESKRRETRSEGVCDVEFRPV